MDYRRNLSTSSAAHFRATLGRRGSNHIVVWPDSSTGRELLKSHGIIELLRTTNYIAAWLAHAHNQHCVFSFWCDKSQPPGNCSCWRSFLRRLSIYIYPKLASTLILLLILLEKLSLRLPWSHVFPWFSCVSKQCTTSRRISLQNTTPWQVLHGKFIVASYLDIWKSISNGN